MWKVENRFVLVDRQTFLDAVPGNARRGRTADKPQVRLYGEFAVFSYRVTTTRGPDGAPAASGTRAYLYGKPGNGAVWPGK